MALRSNQRKVKRDFPGADETASSAVAFATFLRERFDFAAGDLEGLFPRSVFFDDGLAKSGPEAAANLRFLIQFKKQWSNVVDVGKQEMHGYPMANDHSSTAFLETLRESATMVSNTLEKMLSDTCLDGEKARPPRLMAAMRHGVLNGGKRVRPFLVLQSAALFDVSAQDALPTACALEYLHCYSLIHDDLPAMDNDDLRRGKPTVHKAFDDATAILAGDGLLTLAFDIITSPACHKNADIRVNLANRLARASGIGGMIGGQMLDIEAETSSPTEDGIRLLQSMKTGALIRFACEAGAVLGQANDDELSALSEYGRIIGLAFQLADDLLDATSTAHAMGKATGKDAEQGKGTLVGIYGVEKSREILVDLVAEAETQLIPFGDKAKILIATARYIAEREN